MKSSQEKKTEAAYARWEQIKQWSESVSTDVASSAERSVLL